jgi:hypothetical protein
VRPSTLFANTFQLDFHLARLEPLEAFHFFASLDFLRFFTLSPSLARCVAAFRMLGRSAHALYGTRERWDVHCAGLFESEVVRAFEALGGLVKLVVVLGDIGVKVNTNISTRGCHWGIRVVEGRSSHGNLVVGRYAPGGAVDPATI